MTPDLDKLADPAERADHLNAASYFADVPDFSLVLGGPLYQLFRRARLSGDALQLLYRRVLAFVVVTWLPLLVLSAYSGLAVGTTIRIPFLHDLEAQARFLVALPLLIVAELVVHQRSQIVVRRFLDCRLVPEEELQKFLSAVNWGLRLRDWLAAEITLVILVTTVGHWVWRHQVALTAGTGTQRSTERSGTSPPSGTGMRSSAFQSFSSSCCDGTFGSSSGTASCGASRGSPCA